MKSFLLKLQTRLADTDAVLLMALLGIAAGIGAGLCIVAFRYMLQIPQHALLPGNGTENYEELALHWRVMLPITGALVLGLVFQWLLSPESRPTGVVHVINRLHNHQGWLSFKNMLVQFFAGILSLLSGHSLGREGPAVHLGAATGSLLGQALNLPNNSIRALVGCGSAAAIGASFNTPIAGVIFALEVVMKEYTFATFTPIILAAVSGTVVTHAFFGSDPAFSVPSLEMNSLLELPFVLLLGVIAGATSALFIHLTEQSYTVGQKLQLWQRFSLAGICVAVLGIAFPQILGIGYDTVNSAMLGGIPMLMLAGILLTKVVATAICVGFGLPGGLIGPSFVMGACLGGFLGSIGSGLFPQHSASDGFYAMIGMAAMMGATLQAPLSALMALLELTLNPNIILPGMLAVVTANLICSDVLQKKSVFATMLQAQGLDYQTNPLSRWLDRVGVQSVMDRSFIRHSHEITYGELDDLMKDGPRWLLIDKGEEPVSLMLMADAARYAEQKNAESDDLSKDDIINLLSIPAARHDVTSMEIRSTLREALDVLNTTQVEAIYATRMNAPMISRVYGVVTRKDIERYYQSR